MNKRISYFNELVRKNKKIKLKNIIQNHQRKIPAIVTACLLLGIFLTIGIVKSPDRSIAGTNLGKIISASVNSNTPDTKNLNFKNVQRFEVPNAKSTVVYIPQLHKEPTSNASDATNDKALMVQKEIAGMLETLVKDNHIKYVMDETDLYGPMPQDKVQNVKAGFSDIDKVRADVRTVIDHYHKDGGSVETADAVQKSADQKINSFERNIYLTGGAAVLAAKDSNAHVYGSQNPATINEAKVELQNIMYMEQRISYLEPQDSNTNTTGSSGMSLSSNSQSSVASILSMLGNSNSGSSGSSIQPIIDFAKKNNDTGLMDDVNKTMTDSEVFTSGRSYETALSVDASTTQVPANPYQNETNLPKLKQEYQTAYDKFMKLAKDQRSQEVSNNIDRMMQENGQDTSVLVFGMQHKDQLVSALNKKGINVIVITPESENN